MKKLKKNRLSELIKDLESKKNFEPLYHNIKIEYTFQKINKRIYTMEYQNYIIAHMKKQFIKIKIEQF